MINVFIADDHAVVRAGLKQIISETTDILVIGEAAKGQDVLDADNKDDWDVVLLDIAMPGRNGLDTLAQLKRDRPELPILILSMYPEEQYAVQALRAGAAGYLTKEGAANELIAAIRKVAQGGKYVGSSLAKRLASKPYGKYRNLGPANCSCS